MLCLMIEERTIPVDTVQYPDVHGDDQGSLALVHKGLVEENKDLMLLQFALHGFTQLLYLCKLEKERGGRMERK